MKNILENSKLLASYLELVPEAKEKHVVSSIMKVLTDNYENNTIGVRMINTLIHQYFIDGGLQEKAVKKTTFQKTLALK